MPDPHPKASSSMRKKLQKLAGKISSGNLSLFKSEKIYKIRPKSVRALKEALLLGPIAVYVNAEDSVEWDYYTGGILNSVDCGPQTNHAVIGVGYGEQKSKD